MLRDLRIRNFAIIEELSVSFKPGLNVLTGETGAGKSIIVDALGVALGERAYVEMIKTGREEAAVEAFFDISSHPLIDKLGIDLKDGIILRRNITSSGRGKAFINDTLVNVQSLLDVGKTLVDIHGQHEHQSLLAKENQLKLIDRYGGLESRCGAFGALYGELNSMKKRLSDTKMSERERARKADLLKFQISEIESANLHEGEDELAEEERKILANLSRLSELLDSAYGFLYSSEGSSLERLSAAASKLREMSGIDGGVMEPLRLIDEALPLIEEASVLLRKSSDRYNIEPGRLPEVEERLELIKTLKRKYGDTITAILKYKEDSGVELAFIETLDEDAEKMEAGILKKEEELNALAGVLTSKRKEAAEKIETSVGSALRELALEKSVFIIDIRRTPISPDGADECVFLFSANPGEDPKPLEKVASGGELSRVMLAIKGFLRAEDDIPVLIFDEVDSGIGGKTADNIARKLKALAKGRQVLCITHLPQIASLADCHLLIEKARKNGSVYVKVKELSGRERHEEIARMLSGKLTDVSLRHAKELMERAR
jgi:DNA repair protein RecN (Recombination protein N)